MKTAEEIKPCPFCGKQPSTDQDELGLMVFCENENCAVGDMFGCSVAKWNNQAIQSDAIESTVRKCAELVLPDNVSIDTIPDSIARTQYEQRKESKRLILSLITQKEKKV